MSNAVKPITPAVRRLTLFISGLAFVVVPASAISVWPWALTPLTAQAIGAWAIALVFAAAHAFVENTWARARLAFVGNFVFGCLQLIVVLRFLDTIHWSLAAAPTYVAGIAGIVLLGIYGMAGLPPLKSPG